MTTDVCSIWAYDEIKKSGYVGERKAMFLSVFSEAHPLALTLKKAGEMVSERFGKYFSASGFGSRLSELEKEGFLKKFDTVVCEKSGKTVNRWRWTGRRRPLPKRLEWVTCDKCKGQGRHQEEVYYNDDGQSELF